MQKLVYSNLKIFQQSKKLDAITEGRFTAPIYIRLKPTNICNHSCWYCGYQANPDMSMGDDIDLRDVIPHDKLNELCDDFIKLGVKAVTFTGGGEPLVYPKIDLFLDKLLNHNIKVAVITNGANLKGRIASSLAGKASWVRVSMDGWDNQSYIKYRKTKDGEFDKIIENIKNFSTIKGKTKLSISYNVDKDNHDKVYEIAKLMKSIGAETLKFTGCVIYDDLLKNINYHKEFSKLTSQLIEKAKKDFESDGFEIQNVYSIQNERYKKNYHRCFFSEYLTVIGADMNVYACHDKAYTKQGLLGSIKDTSFYDFWLKGDAQAAIKKIDPSIHCTHHCTADQKNKFLSEYMSIDDDHSDFV
jgi:sulfatase maturation enzyme AslB (radical SAM superfamily)